MHTRTTSAASSASVARPVRRVTTRLRLTSAQIEMIGVIATLVGIVLLGAVIRLWDINAHGYNSDEAVYAGQAAGINGEPSLRPFFPVFRAHPLLFQFVLAVAFLDGLVDVVGRYVSVLVGLATVLLAYWTGSLMYGRRAGIFAALFLALMPYHVIVTRQVLLDGPMALMATLALYLMARFARTQQPVWFVASAGAIGLAFEAKETAIILVGAMYAFLALSPEIRIRIRHLVLAGVTLIFVILPFPLSLLLAGGGGAERTQQYLVWQLLRRPNHDLMFYPSVVPPALGPLLIVAVLVGLWAIRDRFDWRERLLIAWIVVPVAFFEIWPVKGFQYLIVVAPPLVILAGSLIVRLLGQHSITLRGQVLRAEFVTGVAAGVIAASLALPTLAIVAPANSEQFLAGSGGVPGGREAGQWVLENVPPGGQLITIGPSMANILQFYGHRKAYGLSVSSNPLHRNPSYEPVPNPDALIRSNAIQYLVWDSYSGSRSQFFSDKLMLYVRRYNGRAVHTQTVNVSTGDGRSEARPVIIIFEVRP